MQRGEPLELDVVELLVAVMQAAYLVHIDITANEQSC